MEFAFSEDEETLRQSIQAFIAENLTDEVRKDLKTLHASDPYEVPPHAEAFFAKIRVRGWTAVSWPQAYGGQGRSPWQQYIVEEEFFRAASVSTGGGGTGTPAILASGTEAQKQEFIPAAINMQIRFCQGYSEPHCGTDLAGIRCQATRQGDTFVVRGQKIYTTGAQHATHIFLLCRTEKDSRRQAGLSVLLVPMNLPGITVRPLWTVQANPRAPSRTTYGEPRTNEVFFDDVVVPESALLGEEGDGWNVAQRGLNLDRVGAARYLMSVMRDEDVVNLLKSGEDPDLERRRNDPRVRDKVAELWIEGQVSRLMTMRSLTLAANDVSFSYEGSAEKVWAPEHGVKTTEAITQILGPAAQLMSSSPMNIEGGLYAHNLMSAYQSTINHGSVQVMRDQIARRGLGMPRPPR